VLIPIVHPFGTHEQPGAALKDRLAVNGIQ